MNTPQKHTARYLDSGFYLISDRAAGALARVLGHKLPRDGYEKFVMLEVTCENGEAYRVNAWLKRTPTSFSGWLAQRANVRGWHWALYAIRRDSGAYLPSLGKSFRFTPVNSTLSTVQ